MRKVRSRRTRPGIEKRSKRVPQKCASPALGTRVLVLWEDVKVYGSKTSTTKKYYSGQIIDVNEDKHVFNVRYDADGSTQWESPDLLLEFIEHPILPDAVLEESRKHKLKLANQAEKDRTTKKRKKSEFVGALAARKAVNHRDQVIGYVLGTISMQYDDDEWIFRQQKVETLEREGTVVHLAESMEKGAFEEHCYELLCRSEVEEAMVLHKEVEKRKLLMEKYCPMYLQKLRDRLTASGISQSAQEAHTLTEGWGMEIVDFQWKGSISEHTHCKFAMRMKSPGGVLFRSIQESCVHIKSSLLPRSVAVPGILLYNV